MDTKLKRSTAFHPHTDGQTEVVNKTMVHLLRGYNSKHPQTWDESLPSLQFAFNRVIHSSTQKSPFSVWAIYRRVPLTCSVGDEPRTGKEEGEQARAQIFLEKRRKVHQEDVPLSYIHSSQHK